LTDDLTPQRIDALCREYRRPGLGEIKQGLIDSFPFPKS